MFSNFSLLTKLLTSFPHNIRSSCFRIIGTGLPYVDGFRWVSCPFRWPTTPRCEFYKRYVDSEGVCVKKARTIQTRIVFKHIKALTFWWLPLFMSRNNYNNNSNICPRCEVTIRHFLRTYIHNNMLNTSCRPRKIASNTSTMCREYEKYKVIDVDKMLWIYPRLS